MKEQRRLVQRWATYEKKIEHLEEDLSRAMEVIDLVESEMSDDERQAAAEMANMRRGVKIDDALKVTEDAFKEVLKPAVRSLNNEARASTAGETGGRNTGASGPTGTTSRRGESPLRLQGSPGRGAAQDLWGGSPTGGAGGGSVWTRLGGTGSPGRQSPGAAEDHYAFRPHNLRVGDNSRWHEVSKGELFHDFVMGTVLNPYSPDCDYPLELPPDPSRATLASDSSRQVCAGCGSAGMETGSGKCPFRLQVSVRPAAAEGQGTAAGRRELLRLGHWGGLGPVQQEILQVDPHGGRRRGLSGPLAPPSRVQGPQQDQQQEEGRGQDILDLAPIESVE